MEGAAAGEVTLPATSETRSGGRTGECEERQDVDEGGFCVRTKVKGQSILK